MFGSFSTSTQNVGWGKGWFYVKLGQIPAAYCLGDWNERPQYSNKCIFPSVHSGWLPISQSRSVGKRRDTVRFSPNSHGPQIESGPEGRGESNTHQQHVPNRWSWLVGIAFKGARSSSPSVYSQPGGRQIVCGLAWNLLMRDSTPTRCFKDTPEAE